MTILEAIDRRDIFARWFTADTWHAWRVFLAALFGLPIAEGDAALYHRHTGRQQAPTEPAREAWVVVGRRGGKSRIAALVATYLAVFRDYSAVLAPGEVGTLAIIAADRKQARTILRYVSGFLEAVPMLQATVVARTAETITLSNRVVIEVHTASWRTLRGYTLVGVVADELAFWRSEDAANPDHEILAGLRPGMATVPGALLLCISSPYARRGALWEAYTRHFGAERDPVLVWQADTAAMNPTVDPQVIADAYDADEAAASAEYGALFRQDVEGFVSREAVRAVVIPGRFELPFCRELAYQAFVDPSGGARDSMTLAVAHRDPKTSKLVLDCIREARPPFNPSSVVHDFITVLHAYRITSVVGDRYSGEWVREAFRTIGGVSYRVSERTKSEIYGEVLPLINGAQVELLDHKRMVAQLCALERRTARGGKDSIAEPPGPNSHDDVINAAAGAVVTARDGERFEMKQVDIW
jgi:hypothetical protein